MKNKFKLIATLLSLSLLIVACSTNNDTNTNKSKETVIESVNETKIETVKEETKKEETTTETSSTVKITDNNGEVEVPVNSKSVVVLDSRSFETIADWGIKPLALPKNVMPKDNPLTNDESIQNIGNHREPNFEILASVNPEVVIIGQRFAQHYDAIKELLPNAKLININIDLSVDNPGKALISGLKRNTEILGKVFDKNNEAKELINKFDKSVLNAKSSKTDEKFIGLIVSGGNIGYSAPVTGRVWGPVFNELGLTPALELSNASKDHKGDDISVESIAESNPDALLILDRDAAISTKDSIPAKDVIEGSQTLQLTNAVKNGRLFYAPNDTYTNESIQTYIELFENLADFLKK